MNDSNPALPTPTINTSQIFRFQYVGKGSELALIIFKNIILTLLTFGIYFPWARTNMRRYYWGHTLFMGDRAQYTGTGKELFTGWFKVAILLVLAGTLIKVVPFFLPPAFLFVTTWIMPLAYLWLFTVATYSGYRYRLSRTSWRQIRFGVERNKSLAKEFSKIYIKGVLLSIFTLGYYYPFFKNNVYRFLTRHSRLGNTFLDYDGDGSEYLKVYVKSMLLTIFTFGFYGPWARVNIAKYRLSKTQFQGARFRVDLKGGDLLKYIVGSFFLAIFTFGLASPWILNWGHALFINACSLEGNLNIESILNAPSTGSASGESLSEVFDIDFGF